MLIRGKKNNGFTLVELMVALMVSAVVLGAVATLANATVCADDRTEEMGRSQAQLRHMAMRLTDLIRRANGIMSTGETEFLLWHDLNADGASSADELTRIRNGSGQYIEIVDQETYDDCSNVVFAYDGIDSAARFITIWFDMEENGITQTYTISARLRASDDHL